MFTAFVYPLAEESQTCTPISSLSGEPRWLCDRAFHRAFLHCDCHVNTGKLNRISDLKISRIPDHLKVKFRTKITLKWEIMGLICEQYAAAYLIGRLIVSVISKLSITCPLALLDLSRTLCMLADRRGLSPFLSEVVWQKQVTNHGLMTDTTSWLMRYTKGQRGLPHCFFLKLN